jgi:uncharacterized SAM-dependent methyltransferase
MGKEKINDLIFKELIKRGYSLEGKTRIWNIADSKLWYLTPEQAQAFLDLEKSEDYKENIIEKEIKLMKKNMPSIIKSFGNGRMNIIDLGCGDGRKAALILKTLKNKSKVRYCPIDISNYMVEKAIKNIKKLDVGEIVEFQWNISDFDNLENISQLLRLGGYNKNLFLLLGNTLGNFEINELLYAIRKSMHEGDVLIVGNGLNNENIPEIIKSYKIAENHKFLVKILTQIGLKEEDLDYDVRFENSRVEFFYILKRDITLEFLNKKIDFKKGDQIIVAVSYKYGLNDFKSFMKLYFDYAEIYTSENNSYALALCQK